MDAAHGVVLQYVAGCSGRRAHQNRVCHTLVYHLLLMQTCAAIAAPVQAMSPPPMGHPGTCVDAVSRVRHLLCLYEGAGGAATAGVRQRPPGWGHAAAERLLAGLAARLASLLLLKDING